MREPIKPSVVCQFRNNRNPVNNSIQTIGKKRALQDSGSSIGAVLTDRMMPGIESIKA